MRRPLRVLMAEDNPDDAELTLRELRRAGFEPEWERVDSEKAYRARLVPEFEIVISDFEMPQFSGTRALELLKESGLDVPFILISGTIGEETAVAAMQQGAADYLMKDRLTRLGPAVSHALETNRLRREREIALAEQRQAEQERRVQAHMLNTIGQAVIATDLAGRITYANQFAEKLYGWPLAEVLGQNIIDVTGPQTRRADADEIMTCLTQGKTWTGEFVVRRRDGTEFPAAVTNTPLKDEAGDLIGLIGISEDISARQAAEEALRRREALLSNAQRVAALGIWEFDVERNHLSWSDETHHIFGVSREEFGHSFAAFFAFIHPEDQPRMKDVYAAGLADGSVIEAEYRIVRPDGEERTVAERGEATMDANGRLVRKLGVVLDITASKVAERALREAENKYRSIFEHSSEGIFQNTPEGIFMSANPALARMLGFASPEELIRERTDIERQGFARPAQRAEFRRLLEEHGSVREFEYEVCRRDGTCIWVSENARVVRDADRRTLYYEGSVHDITARKTAAERIQQQAALLDLAHDAIMVRSIRDQILYWNRGAERLYGWAAEEVAGKSASSVVEGEETPASKAAHTTLLERGQWSGECRHRRRDGGTIIVRSRWTLMRDKEGKPVSVLVINTDITEQKRTEEQFLRAQRLESIGTLASGVAHDLNNVLVPILMVVPILRGQASETERERFLEIVETSAQRGAAIVKQVLTFARGAEGDRVLLQPIYLLQEVAKIAEETFPKRISVSTRYPEDVWTLNAEPTQLHQILLNLAINARDAMPEGGTLTFEAENFGVDDQYASMTPGATAGPHVLLRVRDTGSGIPPHALDKIFDPFFTTKALGTGTGLGLSSALGIVKSHGGFMKVTSVRGDTSFEVFIPAVGGLHAPASTDVSIPRAQGELILIVDDEAAIREVAQAVLVKHGYRVALAEDGPAAIALFAQHAGEIAVVLTDMMMPFMDGVTLIRTLRKMNPAIRVIISTGQDTECDRPDLVALSINACLVKPFNTKRLLLTLHNVLQPDAAFTRAVMRPCPERRNAGLRAGRITEAGRRSETTGDWEVAPPSD